jgi:arogenate/prephenate dehydratase
VLSQGDKAPIAYQGAPGAYSEGAALQACPDGEPLPCEQFETAVLALAERVAERAVMPIENSLGGSIHAVYDLLLR